MSAPHGLFILGVLIIDGLLFCKIGKGLDVGRVGGREDDDHIVGSERLDGAVNKVSLFREGGCVAVACRDEDICIGAVLHLRLEGLGAVKVEDYVVSRVHLREIRGQLG